MKTTNQQNRSGLDEFGSQIPRTISKGTAYNKLKKGSVARNAADMAIASNKQVAKDRQKSPTDKKPLLFAPPKNSVAESVMKKTLAANGHTKKSLTDRINDSVAQSKNLTSKTKK